jgi:hypothetical protein
LLFYHIDDLISCPDESIYRNNYPFRECSSREKLIAKGVLYGTYNYNVANLISKGGYVKKIFLIAISFMILGSHLCYAGILDDVLQNIGLSPQEELDTETIIKGLKEALSVGTDDAVKKVSQVDGYLGNEAIKILMPEKIRNVADMLKKVGFQKEVDDFVISMNRAAEGAAPKATNYFIDAIKALTIDDAKKILNGEDTAATDYFRDKTYDQLFSEFKPSVSSSMGAAGVTRFYKDMMDEYLKLPFVKKVSFDLDDYVTTKSIDGLFLMVAEEEKKIRTDPAARVTDILKKVFAQ